MTVSELVKILTEFPPNLSVYTWDREFLERYDIERVVKEDSKIVIY